MGIAVAIPVLFGCRSAESSRDETDWVLSTSPADGEVDVSRVFEVRARLDRFVVPDTLNRRVAYVVSGDVRQTLSVSFDVVAREIVMRSQDGVLLEPGVTYRAVIAPGIMDLDGRTLGTEHAWTFRTGEVVIDLPNRPSVTWEQVGPLFARSCASGACHGSRVPSLGLDLSSEAAALSSMVGVPATQMTVPRSTGLLHARPGLWGLPRVDVFSGGGRPERSYVMYKILGESHVLGAKMPPPGTAQALSESEAAWVADWIAGLDVVR